MQNNSMVPQRTGLFAAIMVATVGILATLTILAGFPPAEQLAGFIVGVIVLIAVIIGIGLLGWHLLLRPLPANVTVVDQPLLSVRARQIIALLLTLGPLSIGIAGVWDEIWHSKYGIPFGEDFFWRPHLLLYFGLSVLIFIGGWSWWTVMSRGKGTLQQRFRANPLLGISFLGGLFTIYAVGADPIWHRLYGADIAPWSLPHLLILMLILLMSLLAITFHKSVMPNREWRLGFNFTGRDVLIALVLVGAMLDYLLIFTIQWYAGASGSAKQLAQIAAYPTWLLPVFVTFLATLFGTLALQATRQVGTATLVGLLVLGVRFALDNIFAGVRNGTPPMLVILPMMLALDVVYAVILRRSQKPPVFWMMAIVVAVVYGVVGIALGASLFPYPQVSAGIVPLMVIASLITALAGVWLGQLLGSLNEYRQAAQAAESSSNLRWANVVLYVAFAAFLIFFITTATPPVG